MEKKKKSHVHVMIDSDVWEKTQEIISEMGYQKSGFVEMLFKQMIKSETSPLGDLIEGILKDVLEKKEASKKKKI